MNGDLKTGSLKNWTIQIPDESGIRMLIVNNFSKFKDELLALSFDQKGVFLADYMI
jgi:hypothetical protein